MQDEPCCICRRKVLCLRRLVAKLQPFAGMRHLDVAGGTGDVAFRVLRAIRAAEAETARSSSNAPQARVTQGQGCPRLRAEVTCDYVSRRVMSGLVAGSPSHCAA